MSTRGIIGFRYKNKDYLTYNHFDSYPDGVGKDILKEISKVENWGLIEDRIKELKLVDDGIPPTKEDIAMYNEHKNTSVGNQGIDNQEVHTWYQLLRDIQGTLKPYMNGSVKHMIDSSEFIKDSLFCEWVYIVNLDTMEFEVLVGFQKEKDLHSRYGVLPNEGGYYPCKLIKAYDLNNLPEEDLFEHNFKYNDDTEEYECIDDEEIPYKPDFEAVGCCECGRTVGYVDSSMYDSSLAIYCTECKEEKE